MNFLRLSTLMLALVSSVGYSAGSDHPNWGTSPEASDCVSQYQNDAQSIGVPFDQISEYAYRDFPGDQNFERQTAVAITLGVLAAPVEVLALPYSLPIILKGKMGENLADKMFGEETAKSSFYDRLLKDAQAVNPAFTERDLNFSLLDGFATEFCKKSSLAGKQRIHKFIMNRAKRS